MLYAAYGSNLNVEQMGRRCPGATIVEEGALTDYKLVFRGPHDAAVANVEPQRGGRVPVLLWEISDRDLKALDQYEGWPWLYFRQAVRVETAGGPVQAMAYIMNERHPLGRPSAGYYAAIRDGYLAAGFDVDRLRAATIVH